MRTLVLSIGNTSLFGGVHSGSGIARPFRVPVHEAAGPGFNRVVAPRIRGKICAAVICSVVPSLTREVSRRIAGTFGVRPRILTASAAHGIRIGYRNPRRLGADRLAAALGARSRHPGRNIVIVDCGTAATVTALNRDGTILGGAILPGMDLWAGMLAARTAQLPRISPGKPRRAVGRSPGEAIESGIWHGYAGALREVIKQVRHEAFGNERALVIGTGGNSGRGAVSGLFGVLEPNLVLYGLATCVEDSVLSSFRIQ